MPKGKTRTIAEQIADEVYEMLLANAKQIRTQVKSQVEVIIAKRLGLPHGEQVMEDYVEQLVSETKSGKKRGRPRKRAEPEIEAPAREYPEGPSNGPIELPHIPPEYQSTPTTD